MMKLDVDLKSRSLVTACQIGEKICSSAFWHNSKCNWMGRALIFLNIKGIIPSIYWLRVPWVQSFIKGTSGIALFLGYLYLFKNSDIYKETSIGVMRHAIGHVEKISSTSQFGLYDGKIGIAFVLQYLVVYLKTII